jgi:hypothetical protein
MERGTIGQLVFSSSISTTWRNVIDSTPATVFVELPGFGSSHADSHSN